MALEDRLSRLETQYQELADTIDRFAKDLELLGMSIQRNLKGIQTPKPLPQPQEKPEPLAYGIPEGVFSSLNYTVVQGEKIGEFETANKSDNTENFAANFQRAYNILANAKSEIKNRYHGPGYAYSYWLFGEGKIYRQKLKELKT